LFVFNLFSISIILIICNFSKHKVKSPWG